MFIIRYRCHTKVTQFKIPEFADKDILRFNIPVNNISLLAAGQRFTQIESDFFDRPVINPTGRKPVVERLKKLHLYQNIYTGLPIGNNCVIDIGYNMGIPP